MANGHYKYKSELGRESDSDSKRNRFPALVGTITTLVISGCPPLVLRTKEPPTGLVTEAGLEYYWPMERSFCLTRLWNSQAWLRERAVIKLWGFAWYSSSRAGRWMASSVEGWQ